MISKTDIIVTAIGCCIGGIAFDLLTGWPVRVDMVMGIVALGSALIISSIIRERLR